MLNKLTGVLIITFLSLLHQDYCAEFTFQKSKSNTYRISQKYGYENEKYDSKYLAKIKGDKITKHVIDKYFQFGPSDAIDNIPFSQPEVDFKHSLSSMFGENQNAYPSNINVQKKKVPEDFLTDLNVQETTEVYKSDVHINEQSTDLNLDSNFHLLTMASEPVFNYEKPISSNDTEKLSAKKSKINSRSSQFPDQNQNSNVTTNQPILDIYATQSSNNLSTRVVIELINSTDSVDTNSIFEDTDNLLNTTSFVYGDKRYSSGTVAGIVVATLISVTLLSSAVIYLLYRKHNGRCTSVVEGKYNSDNGGYLDDCLHSNIYLNSHIELPKESSEEMSSLDNDSFLNSLEAMTVQNYWADHSRSTKV